MKENEVFKTTHPWLEKDGYVGVHVHVTPVEYNQVVSRYLQDGWELYIGNPVLGRAFLLKKDVDYANL